MEIPLRKVTARVDLKAGNTFVRTKPKSRPSSPTKQSPVLSLSPPSFRPKAKVNSAVTVRKLSSSSSLSAAQVNSVSTQSRPNSPFKPSRISNDLDAGNSSAARITARPTSRSGMAKAKPLSSSPEPRQRALTAATTKLKSPHPEDRPRSGSVVTLHHALSTSDLKPAFSPPTSQPSPLAERVTIDTERTTASPILAPIKVKSKVTQLAKSMPPSAVDPASRSLSPPYATTRPIHRTRAPSITSSTFSLNDSPATSPAPFYPITTGSPAANPHRYVPRRAPSPARSYPSPPAPSEPFVPKIPLIPKIDPALVPLPPHSPPISAISISSKSSVSRASVSLNGDQTPDNQMSSVFSHAKHVNIDPINQSNVFYPPSGPKALGRRDRSHSRDGSLHDLSRRFDSDAESEGSELQLRAEAKTNRKIADLEITNHSLLAINATLETAKNRQAKEIRDLRRKLRESKLILPPRAFKAVKAAEHDRDDEDEDADEDEDDSDDVDADDRAVDETFQRVRSLIDTLIESGKQALETKPEDFRAGLATKVLNADELRSWRDSGERSAMKSSYVDKQDADDETIHSHLSPALVAVPDSDSDGESDGAEVSDPPSSLPPITVTHSL